MTSLLTNSSAMVALQTLNQINSDLETTNNRVSTGKTINKAQDSAAYWAIAATTDSDNGALGTVKQALNLGKSTLDVVYNGLEDTKESLNELRNLLVGAQQEGQNRELIQNQIDGIVTDMQNKANASVINEQNYLSVDSAATDYNNSKSIVASFERSATGIATSTIDLDIDTIKLLDSNGGGAEQGILDKDRSFTSTAGTTTTTTNVSVLAIDISGLTDSATDKAELVGMIAIVDAAVEDVISAASQVGVNLSRAESQEKFVSALMDANDRAVGALVDADMEEESTRLRALQTQQQLSVQSLSIANTSAQNILTLFR